MDELIPKPKGTTPIPEEIVIQVGQWYWVGAEEEKAWLGCIIEVGSNFAKLEGPEGYDRRVHLDQFQKVCGLEPNYKGYVQSRIDYWKWEVQSRVNEVKAITSRLGVGTSLKVELHPENNRALSTLSHTEDVKTYKKDLIQAKEKELPELFQQIRVANENLALWMKAESLPLQAMANQLKGSLDLVEDRIFHVSLYAGLTEEVTQIVGGCPAGISEKLRILQRRLYMDEECLANYQHGGMEFKNIEEFDSWVAKPENRNRILPFPRCMVAFQVRRNQKNRDWGGSLSQVFIDFKLEQLDKLTFLYIRNGDQLYRMNCDLEFGELIFPGRDEVNLSEPMMVKMFASRVDKLISRREYEGYVRELRDEERKAEAWRKSHPKKDHWKNPHTRGSFSPRDYHPFDKTSVYYDDATKEIGNRIKQYNRIALIVQGLFDRSPIFHPHLPVQLWKPEGFQEGVELVYDGSGILSHGQEPDFETYRCQCNLLLKTGSITAGQDDYWAEKEAEKESTRRDHDWRNKSEYRPERFRPFGNPGPGYVAQVSLWFPRVRKATFQWNRDRLCPTYNTNYGDPIQTSIVVPESRLFNVDAYKLGDFKQFFQDPRTRAKYLGWAPTLIAAEEFHAGNPKMDPRRGKNPISTEK